MEPCFLGHLGILHANTCCLSAHTTCDPARPLQSTLMAAMHAAALDACPLNAACSTWHHGAAAPLQSAPRAALSGC